MSKSDSFWIHLSECMEKTMVPHSSTLAWKIPWMEEPGRLQSMRSLRVRHNWVTSLLLFTFMIGEGNGNPFQYSCLENPRDRGAWWASVYGVAQSRTQLKRLSSSSTPCGILVPWPGIEPVPAAVEAQSLSHWNTRGFPWFFKFSQKLPQRQSV